MTTSKKSNASRAKKAVEDLESKANPKGGRVGGKMHLEDISLGLQAPPVVKTQS